MLQDFKKQIQTLVTGASLLGLILTGMVASAQQSFDQLTLEQALQFTMQNNRNLQSSALDEKISREQTKEILASGLPQVNATGDFKDYLKIPTSLLPAEIVGGEAGTFVPVQFGTQYNVTAGLEASQLLYSQSYLVGLKASKSAQEVAQLHTRKTKEDVIYNTSLTFYGAQISRKQLDILRANLDKLDKQIEISDLQYQNGLIKKLDLDRLKVSRTNLQTDIYNLETAHQQQLNVLKFYMNVPFTQVISLDTIVNENQGNLLAIDKDVNLFQNRTEYQLLNKQKDLYNLDLKNIRAGYFPTLAAFGSYNTMAMRSEFNFFQTGRPWFQTSVIGLRLNVPIFDGLEKRAKAQQSKLRLARLENDAALLEQSITMDITNTNAKLINSRRALAAQKENRLLAEDVYTQTQLQYKEGLASMTDLLNAETSMRDAQNNYIKALVESLIADLELQKSNGSLLKYIQQ
jgi:outer membrane protein TolC